jgi:hypothetical protein
MPRWLVFVLLFATALVAAPAWSMCGTDDESAAADAATADGEGAAEQDLVLPVGPSDDDGPYYFYHGRNFGSEALINPLRLIINGGYGIMQIDNRDNRLSGVDYETGWRNLWKNLGSPIKAIEVDGWGDFFEREITPISINSKKAHYWPNYMQHLIGGGMSYRMYVEWYRYHGYPTPKLMSVATMTAYHLLNEVVENDGYEGYTTDPIADLYIFDPLGILMFSSDRVCGFFAHKLNMADWSYQPAIDFSDGSIENQGQNFAMKYKVPWLDRWSFFYHFGTHGEGGLSYRFNDNESVSMALGLRAKDLIDLRDGVKTVDLAVSGGLFYDRGNSLLASLQFARTKDYRIRLNVYPGLVRAGPVSPGLFVADRQERGVIFGVTINFPATLPVGIGGEF